jgi:D-sedoheptulose 7-phosphate isomerase
MQGITAYLTQLQQVMGRLPLDDVQRVVETLLEGHEAEAKVLIMGNGGSAATASHLACDLSKGTITSGVPRFRVIALTESVPLMTAWANDMSYGDVFVEQLHGLLDPGDIVIAISGSGNSECVIRAVRMAKWRGGRTISLTGCGGGKLAPLTDVSVVVPSSCMEQVEDIHLALGHSICVTLRQELRKRARSMGGQWQEIRMEHGMQGEGRLPFDKAQNKPLPKKDDSAVASMLKESTARLSVRRSIATEFELSESELPRADAHAGGSPGSRLDKVWTALSENPATR